MDFDPEIEKAIEIISKDKPENFSGCIDISEYSDKDWEALHKCNMESDGRTRYGMRKAEKQRGTVMGWSNGTRRWFADNPIEEGEPHRRLQANEMICPISYVRAKRIACYIKELPLYYGSTEAKARGEVSQKEALDIFAEGKGISELLERYDPEAREDMRKYIKEKGWGWFFGGDKEE